MKDFCSKQKGFSSSNFLLNNSKIRERPFSFLELTLKDYSKSRRNGGRIKIKKTFTFSLATCEQFVVAVNKTAITRFGNFSVWLL
ncbi:hypothetical protein B9Q11_03510 [Candidatus Marsarchaeota G2 archaeon ECH_B_SAG-F08]|uniref:Uncharacterized protein n=3 Tax=Candidatus Marsarchaeota group 2 TaxID=2203771 RepID=A0A2R6C0L2_9ARCH|nr:MAG: hypothetical protein B9Q11_03510 [Candidatus Marsarchaeota G2 archaeon ECH_B_SAG-F08]PSO04148.1 MAG: hypothetical protein B9Q13_05490 [Candidatus Marsarchaeota G2 archaeon ECH_B_SAG-G16]PSO04420.1 MAG: hypothetical protein B9Q12_02500 [Candidatus Marsarchaeota G2 archaeon ECH_B_SAG-G06]